MFIYETKSSNYCFNNYKHTLVFIIEMQQLHFLLFGKTEIFSLIMAARMAFVPHMVVKLYKLNTTARKWNFQLLQCINYTNANTLQIYRTDSTHKQCSWTFKETHTHASLGEETFELSGTCVTSMFKASIFKNAYARPYVNVLYIHTYAYFINTNKYMHNCLQPSFRQTLNVLTNLHMC